MADIITTLHPEDAPEDNLYPNVKDENVPSSIARKSDIKYTSEVLINQSFYFTTSFGLLANGTFTLDKPAIVQMEAVYSAVSPKAIAIGSVTEEGGNPALYDIVESNSYNPGRLFCTTFLNPGTYGLYGKTNSNGSDLVTVTAYYLG